MEQKPTLSDQKSLGMSECEPITNSKSGRYWFSVKTVEENDRFFPQLLLIKMPNYFHQTCRFLFV